MTVARKPKTTPEPLRVVIDIPGMRVNTIGNTRRHWRVDARTAKVQRETTLFHCMLVGQKTRDALRAAKSLRVTYVRIAPRKLDRTNAVGAFKHVQDALAGWLGVDDGDDWYDWQWPVQETGVGYGVRIELVAVD